MGRMSLAIPIHLFDYHNVYYHKPVQNTVIAESQFVRTVYSNGIFTMTNICVAVPFVIKRVNNNRYFFDHERNKSIIANLNQLEQNILNRHGSNQKRFSLKLSQQFKTGFIRIFSNLTGEHNGCLILLKISGLWESETECGLAFKFVFGLPIGEKISDDSVHDGDENKVKHGKHKTNSHH
jgi:hypothetical protein